MRETEAAYIADLQTVLSVYVRPAVERRILTLEDTLSIFANLEELCRCAANCSASSWTGRATR